jgi:hypothetical protein
MIAFGEAANPVIALREAAQMFLVHKGQRLIVPSRHDDQLVESFFDMLSPPQQVDG